MRSGGWRVCTPSLFMNRWTVMSDLPMEQEVPGIVKFWMGMERAATAFLDPCATLLGICVAILILFLTLTPEEGVLQHVKVAEDLKSAILSFTFALVYGWMGMFLSQVLLISPLRREVIKPVKIYTWLSVLTYVLMLILFSFGLMQLVGLIESLMEFIP